MKQISHVLEIHKKGSLSMAAEALCISQPALSKSLIQLEDELNNKIFERTKAGMRLTSFGRTFVENATTAKNSLETIEQVARNISSVQNNSFRVSASSLRVAGYAFRDVFDKYHQISHTLKYHQTNVSNTFADVVKYDADIGLIMLPYPFVLDCMPIFKNASVIYEPIAKYKIRLVLSKESPLFYHEADTVDYKLVKGKKVYFGFEQHPVFKMAKTKLKEALNIDDIYFFEMSGESYHMGHMNFEEVVCTAAVHNLYNSLGSTEYDGLLASENIRFLDVENSPCCYEYAFIYRAEMPISETSAYFMDICRKYLLAEINEDKIIKQL